MATVFAWAARKCLATASRHSHNHDALLRALLTGLLQGTRTAVSMLHTARARLSVSVSVCNAVCNTETAVLAPCRRPVAEAVLCNGLATIVGRPRDCLATASRLPPQFRAFLGTFNATTPMTRRRIGNWLP
eukprot:gene11168-biopygen1416